uniref:RNA-directed DNA polymerase, eukaryota, reverse transcriptase zinc-binding domain protein n=1 Tax=Tanacetum cinerariifolium TaxID=118510 RepID=A0A6L2MQI8_TANCI|nr:RNA-directed DNA polymerase, eukaryota, reverse transcriptase zinc-binding domain protein [Tanacetum cinerariifolium]
MGKLIVKKRVGCGGVLMILIDLMGLLIRKDDLIILIAVLMIMVMGLPICEDELMILVGVLMIGVKGLLIGEEAEPFCSRLFGVGVDLTKMEVVASSLKCSHDSIAFLYPGLFVGKNMKYCDGWLNVIRRVQDSLSSWKSRSFQLEVDLL